jgi:hypothetical protein
MVFPFLASRLESPDVTEASTLPKMGRALWGRATVDSQRIIQQPKIVVRHTHTLLIFQYKQW